MFLRSEEGSPDLSTEGWLDIEEVPRVLLEYLQGSF